MKKIWMDVHEPDNMKVYLQDNDYTVIKEDLNIGDYVRGDCVIERKEINDFVKSLMKGRLFEQVKNMKDNYDESYVLISGKIDDIRNWKHERAYYGGIRSLIQDWNIPIARARSDRDLAWLIGNIFGEKKETNRPSRVTRATKSLSMVQENVLMGINQIGVKTSQKILNHFNNIKNVANADIEDLKEVIGAARGKRVFNAFNTDYKEAKDEN